MKNVHDVIRRPVLTEQSYEGFADKKYVFEVAIEANRTEIKKAVEEVFGVEVEKVTTMNYIGKPKRQGVFQGKRADWKKAVVKLKEGSKTIELFEG